jgi:hypothetical protein
MNRFANYSKPWRWLLALAVAALVAGCGGSDGGSSSSGPVGVNPGPAGSAPSLGAVATFGGFGGTAGITSCGATKITGDIGTTAASTLVTGLTDLNGFGDAYSPVGCPGIVTGTIITDVPPPGTVAKKVIADAAALAANDAYLDTSPASRPGGFDPGAGELGALTLAPGIYTSAGGSFAITLVDLYLDAGGNADAVWVFQTASTLVVGTDRSVILAGGAQAKNVFWHVGSAATINGGAHMVGTIIASAGVTFPGGGATLDGRALSLVSAISFLNTTVNVPAP